MNTKLSNPKKGYKDPINLENPILDIGKAIMITKKIAFLKSMFKVLSNVLLIE